MILECICSERIEAEGDIITKVKLHFKRYHKSVYQSIDDYDSRFERNSFWKYLVDRMFIDGISEQMKKE